MFYNTSELYKGIRIIFKKDPHEIIDIHYHKPGKGASVVRVKMKNLISSIIIPQTFRSGERFEKASINSIEAEFLYSDNNNCFFMDTETFESIEIPVYRIEHQLKFLTKQANVMIYFFNDKIIDIEVPNHVSLKVLKCEPAIRKESSSKSMKKAELETGLICNVPSFISVDDIIKVDTRTSSYVKKESFINKNK